MLKYRWNHDEGDLICAMGVDSEGKKRINDAINEAREEPNVSGSLVRLIEDETLDREDLVIAAFLYARSVIKDGTAGTHEDMGKAFAEMLAGMMRKNEGSEKEN